MPIDLYTGQPGNGKTALMVERLMADAKKAERPIFAAGINGLAPGLATVLDDPTRWNEIDPAVEGSCVCGIEFGSDGMPIPRPPHAHTLVPDGSLIFVDEAWKWFGHLHNAGNQKTPKHVLALSEHRHRGIDFVWTTQQPNQLYPFIRGLIAEHSHVVRRFGTSMIDVFKWGELNEEVKSQAKRDLSQRDTRLLPKASFGQYKSASEHTIKAKIPFKVLALPALVVIAGIAGFLAYQSLKPDAYAKKFGGQGQSASADATASGSAAPKGTDTPKFKDATDYARKHLPRFGSMPWTAEVFDQRDVTADPAVICMSSMGGADAQGEHKDPSCTCLTEQGTLYDLSQPECRTIARRGPVYNPYKERRDDRREDDSKFAPMPAMQSGVAMPGVVIGKGKRSQGTFPDSPSYAPGSSVTGPTDFQL